MKRLFCAVKVPLVDSIEEVIDVFHTELSSEAITWVNKHHLHITIKFFGDTPNDRVDPLVEALHLVSADFPPFSFRVEGCGTFGPSRQPRVIWLGIRKADMLIALQEKVQHQLSSLGYEPEQRLFVPHLTIGRIKQLTDHFGLTSLESDYKESHFSRVEVGSFYLIESKLLRQGPVYTDVERFVLGEGHRA